MMHSKAQVKAILWATLSQAMMIALASNLIAFLIIYLTLIDTPYFIHVTLTLMGYAIFQVFMALTGGLLMSRYALEEAEQGVV